MELGSCRVHSAMRLTSLSTPSSSSSAAAASMHAPKPCSDDADGTWECFPCPFCYVEVEVPVLCTHLQEEHCFDMKNAVCPICAANPRRDIIEHMTVEHSYLLERRKSQRTNLWTSNLESLRKEAYEHSSLLGAATKKRGNSSDSAPDPLLSSFIRNSSFTDNKNHRAVNCDAATKGPSCLSAQSGDPSTSDQVLRQDYEARSQIANFLQKMLLSTIF